MNKDQITEMARGAGIADAFLVTPHPGVVQQLERFAALAQAVERNKLAAWMIAKGYATGHGDTTEDLLEELEREIGFDKAELWIKRISEAVLTEREACAKVCDAFESDADPDAGAVLAKAIRARGQA
jgi:hypothetical protein